MPEEQRAAALRAVADAGERRAALLAQADEILKTELRPLAVEAARVGADRNRIREVARVGPSVLYRWLTDAGLPVRAKKQTRPRKDTPR